MARALPPAVVYPRSCPLCHAVYVGTQNSKGILSGASDAQHATLLSTPGGTPSPWVPGLPGRVLLLRCSLCGGNFEWDYFGSRELSSG